eukprot:377176-Hanusia_phi.AAC.1
MKLARFPALPAALLSTIAVVLATACLVSLFHGGDESSELLGAVAKKKLEEAVRAAGRAPSTKERAAIEKIVMPIANHLATRMLYTEVAERARANPKKPGHQAMEHVLASSHERSSIEARVKNKLVNIHSGEWAEEVGPRDCVLTPPCSPCSFLPLLPLSPTRSFRLFLVLLAMSQRCAGLPQGPPQVP